MVILTDRLDMTIVVDWDVKPQIKQTNKQTNRMDMTKLVVELPENQVKAIYFSVICIFPLDLRLSQKLEDEITRLKI